MLSACRDCTSLPPSVSPLVSLSTTGLEIDDAQPQTSTIILHEPLEVPRLLQNRHNAEYQEWPFQGFLKRTKTGNETTYNLEFQLSLALGMRSNKETSAETATPRNTIAHSKVWPATLQSKRKRVPWKPEENETILKMKEEGCSWQKIHAALPHRTIQVQYSTKLKKYS